LTGWCQEGFFECHSIGWSSNSVGQGGRHSGISGILSTRSGQGELAFLRLCRACTAVEVGHDLGRLDNNMQTGDKLVMMDRRVDWPVGDQIVVTTTDYLPGHSQAFTIASVGPKSCASTPAPLPSGSTAGTLAARSCFATYVQP